MVWGLSWQLDRFFREILQVFQHYRYGKIPVKIASAAQEPIHIQQLAPRNVQG